MEEHKKIAGGKVREERVRNDREVRTRRRKACYES